MTPNRTSLCLAAIVIALLVPASGRATDPEKKAPTDAEKLDLILRQLGELKSEMKEARSQAEVKNRELDDRLKFLTDRVERLEKSLDRASVTQRSSFFQPTPLNPVNPVSILGGTIVLQNTWLDWATVVLNGKEYPVAPGQTLTLPNQPTGVYSYEVVANGYGTIRGPVTRNLENNKTLTIYVYPTR